MIEVKDLNKSYINKKKKFIFFNAGNEVKHAVKGIDMEIHPGEIVGLLGINGAGKTTTIKMLTTLLLPSSGSITVDGLDIVKDAKKVKKIVNMIAGGERMLYFRLTGQQNLEYFGSLYGLHGSALKERARYLLEKVGLESVSDIPIERYSKGMKQRLSIARGLINDPKYLFLDEPTLGLDITVAKKLRSYIQELAYKEGKGILLTSHYINEVEELCNRLYILDNGRFLTKGTPEKLISIFTDNNILKLSLKELPTELELQLRHELLNPNEKIEIAKLDTDVIHITIHSKRELTSKVIQAVYKAGVELVSLSVEKPKLEDAILSLTENYSEVIAQ